MPLPLHQKLKLTPQPYSKTVKLPHMTTVTLLSKYFNRTLSVRVSDDIAAKLLSDVDDSMAVINAELDRVAQREEPRYLSAGQCRRIASYLKGSGDYWADATAK